MVDGGKEQCDCSLFIAQFWQTDAEPWRCSNSKVALCKQRVVDEETAKARVEAEDAAASNGDPSAHADGLHARGIRIKSLAAVSAAQHDLVSGKVRRRCSSTTYQAQASSNVQCSMLERPAPALHTELHPDRWLWPTWKLQRDVIRPLCRAGGRLGLGRIVALCCCSSASYQNR
jgi:hypothetical protein